MEFRTDLALEAAESLDQTLAPEDVEQIKTDKGDAHITKIHIHSSKGAQALGRAPGTYITVEVPPLSDNGEGLEELAQLVGEELAALLPKEGAVLVTGLGNESITPDALGPQVVKMVLATRHITGEFARSMGLDDLRGTAVISPGVLGQTGVESGEIIRGICEVIHPAAVIAVDALASRSLDRLGCTIQLCDTGIAPGSGVGNNRKELTRDLLGVPVIAMGVPTVVDAHTLAWELTHRPDAGEDVTPRGASMMVTPREIDLIISRASRLVAMSIHAALQPDYSPLELLTAACE